MSFPSHGPRNVAMPEHRMLAAPNFSDHPMVRPPDLRESNSTWQATKRQKTTETPDNDCIRLRYIPSTHPEVSITAENNRIANQDLVFTLAPNTGYAPSWSSSNMTLHKIPEVAIVTIAKLNQLLREAAIAASSDARISRDIVQITSDADGYSHRALKDHGHGFWQSPLMVAQWAQFKGIASDASRASMVRQGHSSTSLPINVARKVIANACFYYRQQGDEKVHMHGNEELVIMFSRERIEIGDITLPVVVVTPLVITDMQMRMAVYGVPGAEDGEFQDGRAPVTRRAHLVLEQSGAHRNAYKFTSESVKAFAAAPVLHGNHRHVVHQAVARSSEYTHGVPTCDNVLNSCIDHNARCRTNFRITLGIA